MWSFTTTSISHCDGRSRGLCWFSDRVGIYWDILVVRLQLVKIYIKVFILSEVISLILILTSTPSFLRFSDLLGAAQLSLAWILQPEKAPTDISEVDCFTSQQAWPSWTPAFCIACHSFLCTVCILHIKTQVYQISCTWVLHNKVSCSDICQSFFWLQNSCQTQLSSTQKILATSILKSSSSSVIAAHAKKVGKLCVNLYISLITIMDRHTYIQAQP